MIATCNHLPATAYCQSSYVAHPASVDIDVSIIPSISDLLMSDSDDAPWGGGDALGTIALRVVPVQPITRKAAFRPASFAGVGAVHERSKKAGAHCVS